MDSLPALVPGQIMLITGEPRRTSLFIQELIVHLALQAPLRCLVGGNRYPADAIAYRLAGQDGVPYRQALERIQLSRAFTCYQMVELLRSAKAAGPTIVLDLLDTFADESVRQDEVEQLLRECIFQLDRLRQSSPLVVSAHPPPNRPHLLEVLAQHADGLVLLEEEQQTAAQQLRLF